MQQNLTTNWNIVFMLKWAEFKDGIIGLSIRTSINYLKFEKKNHWMKSEIIKKNVK